MSDAPSIAKSLTVGEIHIALRQVDGDRIAASAALGITRGEMQVLINSHPELDTLWGNPGAYGNRSLKSGPPPPTDEVSLDRPAIETDCDSAFGNRSVKEPTAPPASADDLVIAAAVSKESFRLCRGLENLGLTEKEVGEAFGLAEFHGLHFKDSLGVIGGGMTRLSIKYQTVVNNLIEVRLIQVAEGLKEAGNNPALREPWIKEEKMLYESLTAIGAECRKIMDVANRGALTQAVVRSRYNNANGNMNGMKRAKPSFSRGDPMEAS